MNSNFNPGGGDRQAQIIAEARQNRAQREKGYRERAMKLFDPICARCGREFEGKRLRELTVHHKDHNHNNNPPDGSNWELLCVYCHDNEHSRYQDAQWLAPGAAEEQSNDTLTHQPFANLAKLLQGKKEPSDP
jgi:5-methylcytosine-specific restriction endonuclease McrA